MLSFLKRFPFASLVLAFVLVGLIGWLVFRDWIWNNWPAWEDGRWEMPFGTLTDVVSIGLGVVILFLTIYVALRQFKIMRDQTAMMVEQGRLSKRQTELAETQDAIVREQLGRRAIVEIDLSPGIPLPDGRTKYRVLVGNTGTRTVKEYTWEFFAPSDVLHQSSVNLTGGEYDTDETALRHGLHGHWITGYSEVPVFPKRMIELGTITINSTIPDDVIAQFFWKVICEDGVFPADGSWGHLPIHYIKD